MATQAQRRKWRNSVERALTEREAAERYELRQRAIRRGGSAEGGPPRALELDALGVPIPRPVSRLVQRLRRLINAG